VHRAEADRPLATAETATAAQQGSASQGAGQQAVEPPGTDVVPADLSPALEAVAADNPSVYTEGCHRTEPEADPAGCRTGEKAEAPLVFLFGDSHAASWYPALEQLAAQGKIRLDSNTKNSCLPLDIDQQFQDRPYTECEQWREGVMERIEQEQPDLVILAGYHNPERVLGEKEDLEEQWRDGLTSTLSRIEGPEVAVMREVPHQERTPTHCLAKNLEHADRCAEPRESAFNAPLRHAEEDAVAAAGPHARLVDLTPFLCNEQTCPTIIGNTVVFRDNHHLTDTFSRQMAEPMWEEIRPLVA